MRERPEATALLNPVRVEMLRWIGQSPGITQARLAGLVAGASRRYARHHLDLLARAGLVAVVRHGNANTYMLKGQPFLLAVAAPPAATPLQPGGPEPQSVPSSTLAAELNHPVRRLIFETLRARGPSHYLQMHEAWRSLGIAPSLPSRCDVSYHGKRMEDRGILGRARQRQHVVWSLRIDPERLKEAESCWFLQSPHFKNIYDAARRSRVLRKELSGDLPAGDPQAQTVGELLGLLQRVSGVLAARNLPRTGPGWPSHGRLDASSAESPVRVLAPEAAPSAPGAAPALMP